MFFRSQAKLKAERRNVEGWVQNLSDGRVEAVFEGEKEDVWSLIEFCKQGPSRAIVTNVEVRWETYTGKFDGFRIKYF